MEVNTKGIKDVLYVILTNTFPNVDKEKHLNCRRHFQPQTNMAREKLHDLLWSRYQ